MSGGGRYENKPASDARTQAEAGAAGFSMPSGPSGLRLQTAVRLRWVGVVGQLIAIGFVHFVLGFSLPIGFCLAAIALSAWLNVFLRLRFSNQYRLSSAFATVMLSYDILQLALLLYLTGGVDNPFTFLIVAPVTVSAASLPHRSTVFLGLLAVVVSLLLAKYHLPLPWKAGEEFKLPILYKMGVVASILACMVFLALYTWRLSNESTQMAAALAATEYVLAREQKLHALDGLAAAAAHELGTPLGTITVIAKELERELPKESALLEDISLLRSQALRCRDILQTLTQRPKETDPIVASLSVQQLLQEAVDGHDSFGKRVKVETGPSVAAVGAGVIEPEAERRPGVIFGLGNLVENAIDFAKSEVTVSAEWTGQLVEITVADDGAGFGHDVIDTLGEPYVTTRAARGKGMNGETSGMGLGFFIAKTLLERSGAELSFSNRDFPETGAVIRITWPREAFIGTVNYDFPAAAHKNLAPVANVLSPKKA